MSFIAPTVLLTLLMLAALPAFAQLDQSAEREQLRAQRAEIETRFAQERDGCEQRFAVNACVDEAKGRRSAALRPLQRREIELDAAQRKARAAAQQERVAERNREAASEEGRKRTEVLLAPPRQAASQAAPRPPRAAPKAHAESYEAQVEKAEHDAKRNRERMAERQREQRDHLKALEERQRRRAAEGKKPAAPLPPPSAPASR